MFDSFSIEDDSFQFLFADEYINLPRFLWNTFQLVFLILDFWPWGKNLST